MISVFYPDQYGISALVCQTSFRGETAGGVAKCQLPSPRRSTPLYEPYRCVPPQGGRVLRRFGLKTGIDFAYFFLELGMVFEGTTGVYERVYHMISVPND